MGFFSRAAAAAILLALLAACTAQREGGGGHPNLIIVREFSVSSAAITLDPSFGFSLYRGSPGVPPTQRAASVGRAAAFSVADSVVQQLAALGYDVAKSNTAGAEPSDEATGSAANDPLVGRRKILVKDNGDMIVHALVPDPLIAGQEARSRLELKNKLGQPLGGEYPESFVDRYPDLKGLVKILPTRPSDRLV
jgi:hypothetical protein